jgi:D-beta-D-heptose 7-phosphate kinase/D-beta-D-heptose 1-phosphate adenosyltransferase
MLVVPARKPHYAIPAWRRSVVFDTTGAGDTVVALIALSLAAGATLPEAAQVANAAASITVSRIGTVSIETDEIFNVLTVGRAGKVLERNTLATRVRGWHNDNKRVVFTNGCFDLLHAGHLSLLHEAARHGDIMIVAINSDASVSRLKGAARPLIPEGERAEMLAALKCVDAVTIFAEDTPLELLRAIRPDVLVKGGDYGVEQVVGHELVESAGGQVVLVPLLPKQSTTALINRIANRNDP